MSEPYFTCFAHNESPFSGAASVTAGERPPEQDSSDEKTPPLLTRRDLPCPLLFDRIEKVQKLPWDLGHYASSATAMGTPKSDSMRMPFGTTASLGRDVKPGSGA
jgi:hypothetical protein